IWVLNRRNRGIRTLDKALIPRFSEVGTLDYAPTVLTVFYGGQNRSSGYAKNYSDGADSFGAGCLTGVDRVAAARRAALLRRKYATRRLRFTRTRSCCPIESLMD